MSPRTEEDAVAWLRLIRSENVGAATFHALLGRYGTAAAALDALPALAAAGGLKRPIRIAERGAVLREVETADRIGARHVFLGGPGYPPSLAAIHAPPPVLMVRGDLEILTRRPIAVVGARKASSVGTTIAGTLAAAFADHGHAVVSGLATGIDTAAHKAALAGGTVAALAGGVDRPTPETNTALAEEIIRTGALISEMPLGWSPYARDFPRRNRLIAGLSEAVVVVEAAANSGALHTARFALDENRDLFAVPGSPLDPRAAGCLRLLRDGASMAIDAEDVLQALRPQQDTGQFAEDPPPAFAVPVAFEDDPHPGTIERIADSLSLSPIAIDTLARSTGLPVGEVLAALVELELGGRAEIEPDGTARLCPAATA
ncbi:DNA-processing protein DprA [Acuticoccus sp. M5D2P5]|uniref:DNA-processing protein DprA n=1 Tax=Acuticoccus kalidii TaxID=2910977 RepID=UPI001F336C07|nr:DNA-processing protein DprA [Acuticoccus kalidii]MCF3932316.1 DNA-processing protein DprA [Acuticoccus kalidii]